MERTTIFTARINGHDVKFTVVSRHDLTPSDIEARVIWAKSLEDTLRAAA